MNKQTKELTTSGAKELQDRLNKLKSEGRAEIAAKLKEARSHGDLSENAEYEAAKEEQAKMEAEIAKLEETLEHSKIVEDNQISTDKVGIGTIVTILDVEMNEKMDFRMVGATEADIDNGKLSTESPVGAALLNHKVDETVEVETPSGLLKFKILEIRK